MKHIFVSVICNILLLGLSPIILVAQFNEAASRSIFSDPKAYKQGDVITILIIEDTQADNTATTDSQTSTDLRIGGGVSAGGSQTNIGGNLGTGNRFSGRGSTTRNERVRSRLSARIIEGTNLNSLKIEGKRTVTINGETQVISVSGYIRFIDIQPDNTVFSYNISDLTLNYNGEGTITKAQEPGLFTKFLRFLF